MALIFAPFRPCVRWVRRRSPSSLGSGPQACDIKTMSERFKRHVPKPARPVPRRGSKAGDRAKRPAATAETDKPKEIGGPAGPEPTRYGDWEVNGRCVDF